MFQGFLSKMTTIASTGKHHVLLYRKVRPEGGRHGRNEPIDHLDLTLGPVRSLHRQVDDLLSGRVIVGIEFVRFMLIDKQVHDALSVTKVPLTEPVPSVCAPNESSREDVEAHPDNDHGNSDREMEEQPGGTSSLATLLATTEVLLHPHQDLGRKRQRPPGRVVLSCRGRVSTLGGSRDPVVTITRRSQHCGVVVVVVVVRVRVLVVLIRPSC